MEFVKTQDLQIYYRKKFLKRSLATHSLSLCVWLGIFILAILPIVFNRHPDVGEIEHIIYGAILTLIFVSWAVALIRIILACLIEYKNAPRVAYTFKDEGVSSERNNWFIPWDGVITARSIIKNGGYAIRSVDKKFYAVNSWGIDPTELKLAENYILNKLPASKTKRLK